MLEKDVGILRDGWFVRITYREMNGSILSISNSKEKKPSGVYEIIVKV